MDDTRKVFGIDLGTTYSCVAQVNEHDEAVVLKNFEGKTITPSVVYFGENETLVGETAKEYSKLEPEKTVTFIKRQMSRDEAFEKPTKFPKGLTPTEISARILEKVVTDANNSGQYSEPIKKVVITCPAYFGEKERMRTKQAGEVAGLEVLAIINEPTAAAICYGQANKATGEKITLVYDLGGGTFDVTLLKINGATITVIATDGNAGLGGYDWDKTFAKYLLSEFNTQKGTSYTMQEGTVLFNEMMIFAEEQKKRLSAAKESVDALLTIKGDTAKIKVFRTDFDTMTLSLLDETIEKAHAVINFGKEKGFTLNEILLVGGSSRMPQVKSRIDAEFNCNSILDNNIVDECVAKGAAILALNKSYMEEMDKYDSGESDVKPKGLAPSTRIKATNVTSKNYGIGLHGNVIANLILAQTPLDGHCKASRDDFSLTMDNQRSVWFPIYESDEYTKDNYPVELGTLLGEDSLELPLPNRASDQVKIVFDIDTEGFLHIHGEVLSRIIDFKIKLKGVMDENELQLAKEKMANETIV